MSERIIDTRGARIVCTDRGTGDPVFILLHYWGGSSRTWEAVLKILEPDARCIALDQRGWGRSAALDGRHDLDAMADDVEDVVAALGLGAYVLVGHSMGGKLAQIVAARGAPGLAGLVLVAPAPPEPMAVAPEQRAAMLTSYQSRLGVEQAISILSGKPLSEAEREQVIADTLAGTPEAKREWTEHGMLAAVGSSLRNFDGPVRVIVGNVDKVEQPEVLRAAFRAALPQAIQRIIPNVGHLLLIECPAAVATACFEVMARCGCP